MVYCLRIHWMRCLMKAVKYILKEGVVIPPRG